MLPGNLCAQRYVRIVLLLTTLTKEKQKCDVRSFTCFVLNNFLFAGTTRKVLSGTDWNPGWDKETKGQKRRGTDKQIALAHLKWHSLRGFHCPECKVHILLWQFCVWLLPPKLSAWQLFMGGGGTGQWKYWASKFQMFRDPSPPAFPFAGEILQCHVTFKNVTTTWRLAYVTTVWRGSPHVENMGPHSPDIEYLDLCFWQLFFVDGVFFFGGSTWCWTLWASKHSTSSDPPAPFPCSHGRERWLLIFWSEEYVPTKHSVWRNKIIWCRFYLDP